MRRLLAYCGLPFEPECLRFYENDRRDALTQWKNFEPWLAPLKQALGPVLDVYPDVPDMHS